jgi:hypothetical protein
LNASSIVAFYKSLDFHQNHNNKKMKWYSTWVVLWKTVLTRIPSIN